MAERDQKPGNSIESGLGRGLNSFYFGVALTALDIAIEAARRGEKIQEGAEIDPVSHVYRRDAFQARAERAIGQFYYQRRSGDPKALAFLFIDIEDFKAINSRYTHAGGDSALGTVGQALHLSTRGDHDLLGRLAGDEFADLFAIDDLSRVEETVDDVRGRIRLNVNRLLADEPEGPDQMGLSIGVAIALPGTLTSYAQMCHAADIDMYRDKAERRSNGMYGK